MQDFDGLLDVYISILFDAFDVACHAYSRCRSGTACEEPEVAELIGRASLVLDLLDFR
jgi:hypothetical protein